VRGGCGVLIGRGLMAITREELVGGFTPASSVSREKRGNGGGDDADMRVPPVSLGERERGGTASGLS
jgi:hypothetical protein